MQFFYILNLFDRDKPFVLSTCDRNCANKMIFGEALRIRVKKFEQNLSEDYAKSAKIAITACKLQKFPRG